MGVNSEYEMRLENLEQIVSELNDKIEDIIQWLKNLEEKVAPAVAVQRIRDQWHGFG